ncbi:MAG: 16S rRNA (guanine(527)-N(7))-methyltransferase RsmG [Jatrophihabitantaceae bacterium]
MAEPGQQAVPELPVPPAVVSERFPDQAAELTRYAGWLADAGSVRGLIGPREVPRLWDRHLLNSIALAELVPPAARLVDIGTGAGLPGLALAIVRPDLRVDLVESLLRRANFLTEVVAALDLAGRVRVVRGRAEDRAVTELVGGASYVTARAVAPLDKLVRLGFPLLVRGGSLLAMKGSSAEDELARYATELRKSGAEVRGVVECGIGLIDPPTRVVHLVRR